MLKCTKCELDKTEGEFRVRKALKRGYNSWCKICENAENKKRYVPKKRVRIRVIKTPEEVKRAQKDRTLQHRYGITIEEYEAMYADQGGECRICETPYELGGYSGLYVDHCHKTGKVRGLLCPSCNSAIGSLKDDKKLFVNALLYLGYHPEDLKAEIESR